MDYENFKEQLVDKIKENLTEKGMDDLNIKIQPIEKMNGNYEAMTVTPEGSNIGLNYNLTSAFAAHEQGNDVEEIARQATNVISGGIKNAPIADIEALADYDQMKNKLAMEVVSAERNADLLDKVPHENMEDMAVVYRLVLDSNDDGRASVLVTNGLMEQFGISHEELRADALENAPEIRPAKIQGMTEMLTEMMGDEFATLGLAMDPADEMMFVATTPDKIQGAGVIAYQDFMDQAAEKLGGDFFVLPSSVHEVLLVKDDGQATMESLKEMVQDVNATQVEPEEQLTDNVYHYDSKDHVFELAEKFEARQMEVDSEIGEKEPEHGSVLKDLKDKAKDIADKNPAKDAAQKISKAREGATR